MPRAVDLPEKREARPSSALDERDAMERRRGSAREAEAPARPLEEPARLLLVHGRRISRSAIGRSALCGTVHPPLEDA